MLVYGLYSYTGPIGLGMRLKHPCFFYFTLALTMLLLAMFSLLSYCYEVFFLKTYK